MHALPGWVGPGDGRSGRAARVLRASELEEAVATLDLEPGHPVVVVVGGAANMEESSRRRVAQAFGEAVAPLVERRQAAVVDGGTDTGVMRIAGDARTAVGGTFPLIGVVVEELARLAVAGEQPVLEAQHTHVVLVPGRDWGDESVWLATFASALAGTAPSVTILANGGAVAWDDVRFSISERRPVLVLAGSGRTADELAAATTPRSRCLAPLSARVRSTSRANPVLPDSRLAACSSFLMRRSVCAAGASAPRRQGRSPGDGVLQEAAQR